MSQDIFTVNLLWAGCLQNKISDRDCSDYSNGYCELTNSEVQSTQYCKMKPLQ